MTQTHDTPAVLPAARVQAELAARQRLLNSFLAETGNHDPRVGGTSEFRLRLPASGHVLCGTLEHWSAMGHHVYGEELWLSHEDGSPATPVGIGDVTAFVLAELAGAAAPDGGADAGARTGLAAQIDNSVDRVTRYLSHGRAPRPGPGLPQALTRHAEQSLLLGHPLHPTPKSAEGFDDEELASYAPELGASFQLEYFAVAPQLLREQRVAPGEWLPEEVLKQAQAAGSPAAVPGRALLPVHPWQAAHLLRQPRIRALVDSGDITPLGPLGRPVYPTSSVRTVCDPEFTTVWKLPLNVRITNFVRNNPAEHARRAMDASRLVAECRRQWDHPGFDVLIETGSLGLADPELAADSTVLFRENPFAFSEEAPQVLAALLEATPRGEEPYLVGHVRESCGVPAGPLPPGAVAEWLERYLMISLVPLLEIFDATGISLEAHVQNSLVHLKDGRPTRFYVRDMEGVSVSRRTSALTAAGRELKPDSALLYDHEEAWHRLQYYAVTNHFGHLLHVLAHHGGVDEPYLWSVVGRVLRASAPRSSSARLLLDAPSLPAKANLSSRFTGSSERPSYVSVPNPVLEVTP